MELITYQSLDRVVPESRVESLVSGGWTPFSARMFRVSNRICLEYQCCQHQSGAGLFTCFAATDTAVRVAAHGDNDGFMRGYVLKTRYSHESCHLHYSG